MIDVKNVERNILHQQKKEWGEEGVQKIRQTSILYYKARTYIHIYIKVYKCDKTRTLTMDEKIGKAHWLYLTS